MHSATAINPMTKGMGYNTALKPKSGMVAIKQKIHKGAKYCRVKMAVRMK
jgi:hypothetical protein